VSEGKRSIGFRVSSYVIVTGDCYAGRMGGCPAMFEDQVLSVRMQGDRNAQGTPGAETH
jgi:hypothetical protein